MCDDVSKFLTRARELHSTVNTSTSRLHEHMEVFQKKFTEFGRGGKDFYDTRSSEYETFIEREAEKMRNMETAVNICVRCATEAADVKVQELNKTTLLEEFAEVICNFLEKEWHACSHLEWMWVKVKKDLEFGETRKLSAKEKRKEAKYYFGLFTFVCGLTAATSIVLLNVEPAKFYVMLVIGSLGFVGCILWWLHQLYKCLKKRRNRTNEDQWLKISFAEDIINECKQRMKISDEDLEYYRALNLGEADEKNLDTQFPTADSSESADDSSQ